MELSGYVSVLSKVIYYDVETKRGLEEIIETMRPIMVKCANRYFTDGLYFEDKMSQLKIWTVEGISAYNPGRETKLSSFLQQYYSHNIADEIRRANTMRKNACLSKRKLNDSNKKVSRREIFLCEFQNDENDLTMDDISSRAFFEKNSAIFRNVHEKIEFEVSLKKICSKMDPKVGQALMILYFEDESMSYAANKVGITQQSLTNRLKPLSKSYRLKSLFGR